MTQRHFLFIVSSARVPGAVGNTEWLAREAAAHLPAGATSTWLHLNGLELADFEDRRHDIGSYPMPTGDTQRLVRRVPGDAVTAAAVGPGRGTRRRAEGRRGNRGRGHPFQCAGRRRDVAWTVQSP